MTAVVPTAFHDDGTLDQPGVAALVEAYGEAGAERIVVLGSAGEAGLLDERERNTVIRTALAAAAGLPLLVGLAAGEDQLDAARQAVVTGADILVAELHAPDPEQRRAVVETLSELGPPLVVDHHPSATGLRISRDELVRLTSEAPVSGVVAQSPPTPDLVANLVAAGGPPVVGGLGALHLLEELETGAVGSMVGLAVPERLVEVVRRWHDGNPSGARETYLELAVWFRLEVSTPGVALVVRKEAWRQRGVVASSRVRRGEPLGMATKAAVTRRLQELGLSTPGGIMVG